MAEGFDSSLRMLAAALEKEEKGRDFYKDAVSKCATDLGKDMFRTLMAEEGIHIKRIKEIYSTLESGKAWTEQWKDHKGEVEDLKKLFADRIAKLGPKITAEAGDIEALEVGIEMEQGAITFYEEHLEKATDAFEREFVTLMAHEERSHFAALQDLKHYLEHPEAWFLEREHSTMDGA